MIHRDESVVGSQVSDSACRSSLLSLKLSERGMEEIMDAMSNIEIASLGSTVEISTMRDRYGN